jgi:hypothetical protein
MLAFGVADDRLDSRTTAQLAFDLFSDAPLLAGDIDRKARKRWRNMVARDTSRTTQSIHF